MLPMFDILVFSEPRRLGAGISIEGCVQKGVPEVSKEIYRLCNKSNKKQAAYVLGLTFRIIFLFYL